MKLTVDSSLRTQALSKRNVIAMSNGIKFSVVLRPPVKRKIYGRFKNKHRILTQIHCVAITYCIKDNIDSSSAVQICPDGFNPRWLNYYLKQFLKEKYTDNIIFYSIGKQDNAHKYANYVRKNIREADIVLTEKDFLKYIKE